MALKYVQTLTLYQAGAGNIIGATSVVLTTLTDIYGNAITSMTPFGTKGYITLEPDTTNEEGATFTGVTPNANGTTTLTGISTILAQSPYTETSGLVRNHAGGSKVVVTDNVAFWNTFANINNDQTFTGANTFTQKVAVGAVTSSDLGKAATVDFVNATAVAGAPNASSTVKGIVQEATQAQVLAKTAAGSTGAELYVNPTTLSSTLLSDYKADTGSANAYAIAPSPAITAYVVGQIFSFKATNANTTTSTLNVSALGTKTIKKLSATDLVANDIFAGQIVTVEYDGTNFQMQSQLGNGPLPALSQNKFLTSTDGSTPSFGTVFDYQPFTTNGTWTKPSNLTGNELVMVQMWGGGGGGGSNQGVNSSGGGGGGGGAYKETRYRASDLSATVSVTVGTAGTAGTSGGAAAVAGGNSIFSTLTAFGGGFGTNLVSGPTNGAGGGGGGSNAAGNNASGASGGAGGSLLAGAAGAPGVDSTFGGAGGGSGNNSAGNGGNSIYGGGGGAGSGANTGGGSSVFGGGGGGSGAGGAATSGGSGTVFGNNGGAGGGAGAGQPGIAPGGGGGGAGVSSTTAFNGGAGARGEVRIWTFL